LLFLPVMTCAACWLIAPRSRKGWIIFPLLHVTVGWAATSFNAIGESALAASFWWCLLFMLVFRTRDIVPQILFLAMCAVAFSMHEGAFPLMAVLLVACAVRYRTAANSLEKVFLILCVPIILAILTREVWWVVNPRVPSDRAMVLDGLASL
ncbi:hypothetical protein, partial [Staphylococcus coagulans]|uniref:hypothetical protein n=1 Tax=Staphylococcus coagulans TaxID=74706 RepID=UPI001BE616CB